MKAITKEGNEYEVRLCEPTLYDLERASKHGTGNSSYVQAKMKIDCMWDTVWLRYARIGEMWIPVVELVTKKEYEALGVKYEGKRKIVIRLDKDFAEEYKSLIEAGIEAERAKANSYDFSELIIFVYCGSPSISGWDVDDKEGGALACFNDEAREMCDMFEAAYAASEHEVYKYFSSRDQHDYRCDYTVKKSDMPALQRIAEPVLRRREQQRVRKANIANGAIYFKCESQQHDEDLTSIALTRPCPKDGIFVLTHEISKSDFNRIKRYGVYYDAETLEDFDMFYSDPGWRFSAGAIEELAKDHRVFVDNKEVK